jgi:molecular chaperone Hsp33
MANSMNNIVLPFTLKNADIKGRIIKLDHELDLILNQHQYPDAIARILGELLMVASLIGSQFKDEILLTIQLQIKDNEQYIVADFQSPGMIRGYAKFSKTYEDEADIIKNSLLMVTVDRQNNHRYQGIVEIKDNNISKAIEEYFYQSEQINTAIKLKIGKILLPNQHETWCGGGLIMQRLPLKDEEDSWDEAQLYFSTIRDDELLDTSLTLEKLLYSVYNQMDVITYEPLAIIHKCRCSRERVAQVIESLGYEEALSIIIDNKISISCQFCNKSQDFSNDEIDKLFNKKE